MAELRIYHGKPDGVEPPKESLRQAVETASKALDTLDFEANEIVHHGRVQHYRRDFGSETGGQSAICLIGPSGGDESDITASDIEGDPADPTRPVEEIQAALNDEFGSGVVSISRVDESYRIDEEGMPRALPKELEP